MKLEKPEWMKSGWTWRMNNEFWKRDDWQAMQAKAEKENKDKYMSGSGLWPDGIPKDGAYYKTNDAPSAGVRARAEAAGMKPMDPP